MATMSVPAMTAKQAMALVGNHRLRQMTRGQHYLGEQLVAEPIGAGPSDATRHHPSKVAGAEGRERPPDQDSG